MQSAIDVVFHIILCAIRGAPLTLRARMIALILQTSLSAHLTRFLVTSTQMSLSQLSMLHDRKP